MNDKKACRLCTNSRWVLVISVLMLMASIVWLQQP